MKRHYAAWLLAGAVSVGAVATTSDARAVGPTVAQQTSFKQKQDAQVAFKKGKAAMAKGDYVAALEAFIQADQLHPGAAPKYQIAAAYDHLNKIEEAIAAYRKFIESDPGPKYADRVVAAGTRIAELEKLMIAKVTLQITPANLGGMAITVDGNPIQGTEFEVKPGDHQVVVTAPGHTPVTQTITARAGEPLSFPITLVPETPASG
jgi:tetratricopeptide (TPR) repeat protein